MDHPFHGYNRAQHGTDQVGFDNPAYFFRIELPKILLSMTQPGIVEPDVNLFKFYHSTIPQDSQLVIQSG
jgi:hypothetical protein